MIVRILLIACLAFSLSACGTKTPLDLPNGKPPPKGVKDPSEPPSPIIR